MDSAKLLTAFIDLMLTTGNVNLPTEEQGLDANDLRHLKNLVDERRTGIHERDMEKITRYQGM